MLILTILIFTFSVLAPVGGQHAAHKWTLGNERAMDSEARRLLNSFEPFFKKARSLSANAEWNHQTNLTEENQVLLVRKWPRSLYDWICGQENGVL